MVLLAIPFVFGLLRLASAGQRMMIGSVVGVAFHLVSQIVARVGLLLNLSPAFTALAPVAVVLAVAAWLFRRVY
jgi:lipopolysaccharide export system permease protein